MDADWINSVQPATSITRSRVSTVFVFLLHSAFLFRQTTPRDRQTPFRQRQTAFPAWHLKLLQCQTTFLVWHLKLLQRQAAPRRRQMTSRQCHLTFLPRQSTPHGCQTAFRHCQTAFRQRPIASCRRQIASRHRLIALRHCQTISHRRPIASRVCLTTPLHHQIAFLRCQVIFLQWYSRSPALLPAVFLAGLGIAIARSSASTLVQKPVFAIRFQTPARLCRSGGEFVNEVVVSLHKIPAFACIAGRRAGITFSCFSFPSYLSPRNRLKCHSDQT